MAKIFLIAFSKSLHWLFKPRFVLKKKHAEMGWNGMCKCAFNLKVLWFV